MLILIIDTSTNYSIRVALSDQSVELATRSVEANHAQAEKLLPLLEKLLVSTGHNLNDLTKIIVEDEGEGFTSLRIGIITANALAYALNVPVETPTGLSLKLKELCIVAPSYTRPPSITTKLKKN